MDKEEHVETVVMLSKIQVHVKSKEDMELIISDSSNDSSGGEVLVLQ